MALTINSAQYNSNAEYETVTGEIVTINNAKPYVRMKQVVCDINPVQDLHGYDNPWPAGGGKNKYYTSAQTTTVNDVTFTMNSDGTVSLSGTASAVAQKLLGQVTLPAGTYILNGCPSGGSLNTYDLRIDNSNIDFGSGVQFTLSAETNVQITATVRNGQNVNGKVFKPMIRLATESDAAFAPYSNICPISGWSSAKVTRTGKNLCTQDSKHYGYWISGSWHESSGWYGFIIPVEPGDDLYISGNQSSQGVNCAWLTSRSDPTKGLSGYTDAGTSSVNNMKVTAPQGAKAFWMAQNASADNSTLQVEYGSARTSYEAPFGNTFTISLGDTRYGCTLDVTRGKLRVTHGYIKFVGSASESWGDYSSFNGFYITIYGMKIGARQDGLSNMLKDSKSSVAGQTNAMWLGVNSSYLFAIGVYDSMGNTVESFKSYLSSHNLEVVYPLATPIEVDLTPTEIKTLLGTNNVWTDTNGNITVAYCADTRKWIEKMLA